MATSTHTKNGATSFEAAFDQAKESGEQFLAATRKAGNLYLDSYEKTVDGIINLELKFAGLSQQEWLTNLIEAQADLTREVASSYTSTARSLLK